MSEPTATDFDRRCRAAEELSTLGYAAESELLWRSAWEPLTSGDTSPLDPTLLESVRQLLAERSVSSPAATPNLAWRAWQARARALADRYRAVQQASALPSRTWWGAGAAAFALSSLIFVAKASQPTVVSSGVYSPQFLAAAAVDGDGATEWLLPDHWQGFLDLALPRRRKVEQVTLTNGRNAPWMDRAARRALVIVYDDDREVDRAEVNFTQLEAEPQQRVVRLAGKLGTRVRVDVVEHFGHGAALAEVEIN